MAIFLSSVIVNDLDFVRLGFAPDETNTVLIIDSDTVLSSAITFQCLQPIACRFAKVLKTIRIIQHLQLTTRHFQDGRVSPAATRIEELCGLFIGKGANHFFILAR